MESSFRDTCPDDLRVIETLRYDADGWTIRRDLHLARMAATCKRLAIPFERRRGVELLNGVRGTKPLRVRLTIGLAGDFDLTSHPLGATADIWRVVVAPQRLCSDDPWLSVKTTQRALYDAIRGALPEGIDEAVFLNERGEVCEGTITNIFVQTPKGLLTPNLSSGLLPGLQRAALIADGRAKPAVLIADHLADNEAIFVGNSLRGLIRAKVI